MSTTFSESTTLAPNLPESSYERSRVSVGIVHFGVGGFHRSHQAMYIDRLMSNGQALDWGICGVGVLEGDKCMHDTLIEQDCLYTLILKYPDGTQVPHTIGSIIDHLYAPDAPSAVLDILSAPSTRIVSLTVTEGGYNTDDATGQFRSDDPLALYDAENLDRPVTAFGFIVEALRRRREAGIAPFTVMSCDNLPHNGAVACNSVVSQARLTDGKLADWILENVSFPDSMVDRITPATTDADRKDLHDKFGINDKWPVIAEPFTQWVLENSFTDGRPPFEDAGVQIVPNVDPYELMKLRLLNGSHQSLAHWGRLLGLEYGHDAAVDSDVAAFTRRYLEQEAVPTLLPVPGVSVPDYIDTLFERFSNRYIADPLARLAEDASDRMPKFVIPTIRENLAAGRSASLGIAICAAWALGMQGIASDSSPVRVQDKAWERIEGLVCAQGKGDLTAFLHDRRIFGELEENEEFVEEFARYLSEIEIKGPRAVMQTLVGG